MSSRPSREKRSRSATSLREIEVPLSRVERPTARGAPRQPQASGFDLIEAALLQVGQRPREAALFVHAVQNLSSHARQ